MSAPTVAKSSPRPAAAPVNPQPLSPDSAPGTGLGAFSAVRRVPPAVNEPVRSYAPGSPERKALKERLASMSAERIEIPLVIGGKEIRTGETATATMPHAHSHVLADWHKASREHVTQAIEAARNAHREWAAWSWEDRAAVFLRAAELLSTTRRAAANAPSPVPGALSGDSGCGLTGAAAGRGDDFGTVGADMTSLC